MGKVNASPQFREVQRFREPWIWAIVLSVAALFWFGAFQQLILKAPFGSQPVSNGGMILFWLAFGVFLPPLFAFARLTIEVRGDGVYWQFWPFQPFGFRRVLFTELEQVESCTYRPVGEYGGWGIRIGVRGWAYNVSGNLGVRLMLKNNQQVLLGSQRAHELANVIQESMTNAKSLANL
jgi:hypothetical protein